mmetsp:Transcript_2683/g.8090  ORF Transcript_2683/g.8090 Transcript_2683/m.8090 type:complete len:342 (+) Transcript_2683:228-1253(+)
MYHQVRAALLSGALPHDADHRERGERAGSFGSGGHGHRRAKNVAARGPRRDHLDHKGPRRRVARGHRIHRHQLAHHRLVFGPRLPHELLHRPHEERPQRLRPQVRARPLELLRSRQHVRLVGVGCGRRLHHRALRLLDHVRHHRVHADLRGHDLAHHRPLRPRRSLQEESQQGARRTPPPRHRVQPRFAGQGRRRRRRRRRDRLPCQPVRGRLLAPHDPRRQGHHVPHHRHLHAGQAVSTRVTTRVTALVPRSLGSLRHLAVVVVLQRLHHRRRSFVDSSMNPMRCCSCSLVLFHVRKNQSLFVGWALSSLPLASCPLLLLSLRFRVVLVIIVVHCSSRSS